MKPSDFISNDALTGVQMTSDEQAFLADRVGELATAWFLQLVADRCLAGSSFCLDELDDVSGLGVELQWMTAEQIVHEATNFYPGITATKRGYLPFGKCLEGSGDPYFLRMRNTHDDTLVVRIPHDAIWNDELDEARIELVANNLAAFFQKARTG